MNDRKQHNRIMDMFLDLPYSMLEAQTSEEGKAIAHRAGCRVHDALELIMAHTESKLVKHFAQTEITALFEGQCSVRAIVAFTDKLSELCETLKEEKVLH